MSWTLFFLFTGVLTICYYGTLILLRRRNKQRANESNQDRPWEVHRSEENPPAPSTDLTDQQLARKLSGPKRSISSTTKHITR